MTTGLVYYPASHRYKFDGEWVPGVTTIIGVLDKPGLRKWAAATVAEYVADNRDAIEHLYAAGRGPMVAMLKETPWQRRDDAATRGTSFHEWAAYFSAPKVDTHATAVSARGKSWMGRAARTLPVSYL